MSNFAPTLNLLEVPGERQKYPGPHAFPLRARQMCQDDKTPCIFGPGSCGSCRESTQSHSDIVRDVGHICTKPRCMCAFKYMRIHMHCTKLYSVKLMSGYRFYRNQALEVGFEETLYPLPNPAGCPATAVSWVVNERFGRKLSCCTGNLAIFSSASSFSFSNLGCPNMPLGRKEPCGNPFNQAAAGPLLEDALLRLVGIPLSVPF